MLLSHATPHLSVRERLGELHVPTLLVNGVWEKRFQSARDWLHDSHPHIAIEDLPGGHSINIDCPNAFDVAVMGIALSALRCRRCILPNNRLGIERLNVSCGVALDGSPSGNRLRTKSWEALRYLEHRAQKHVTGLPLVPLPLSQRS